MSTDELRELEENFGEWVESNGVELIKLATFNGTWNAQIDLNVLKPAIMRYAEQKAQRIALEARIDETRQVLKAKPLDGYDVLAFVEKRRIELKSQLQELES